MNVIHHSLRRLFSGRRKPSGLARNLGLHEENFPSAFFIGLARFELTTSCTPCKRSTKLNYSPCLLASPQHARMLEVCKCKDELMGFSYSSGVIMLPLAYFP